MSVRHEAGAVREVYKRNMPNARGSGRPFPVALL